MKEGKKATNDTIIKIYFILDFFHLTQKKKNHKVKSTLQETEQEKENGGREFVGSKKKKK